VINLQKRFIRLFFAPVFFTPEINHCILVWMSEQEIELTVEQRRVFRAILQSIDRQENSLFFINGPASSGKTTLLCELYKAFRAKGDHVRFLGIT
jgi:ABC-type cobalamin/Fe3+-siderophores transport system ATPase subunit